ncbi:MAG: oligosaccharide flippase family protein, partial [Bacteroidota bacterium]
GYLVFSGFIKDQYATNSPLFLDYYYFTIPLAFFILFSTVLESYLQALYKTVLTNFLKNVLVRLLWLGEILMYWAGWVDLRIFLILFVSTYAANLSISVGYLASIGQFNLKPDANYFKKRVLRRFRDYSGFSILTGVSNTIVGHIDKAMVGYFLGLGPVAIFSMASYLSTIVYVPAQAIGRITLPVISRAWKDKDMAAIKAMYQKTSLIQLVLGAYILIGVWVNVDSLFTFLPEEYALGKYVILYVGLAKLLDMTAGANGQIITISKFYPFDTLASALLIVITISFNLLFIPWLGMDGAAIASLMTLLLYNGAKMAFLWKKLGFQPFTWRTLLAIGVGAVTLWTALLIPTIDNVLLDIAVRSTAVTVIYFVLVYLLKVSPDITSTARMIAGKVGIRLP